LGTPDQTTFPLSRIVDNWRLAEPFLDDTASSEARPNVAFHATLSALRTMYDLQDPAWLEVRDKVQVGCVKESSPCNSGNTSVSMGCAATFFVQQTKRAQPFKRRVALLNCGTGGVKLQLYGLDPQGGKMVVAIDEFKGGDKTVLANTSFSLLKLEQGGFDPSKTGRHIELAQLQEAYKTALETLSKAAEPFASSDCDSFLEQIYANLARMADPKEKDARAGLERENQELYAKLWREEGLVLVGFVTGTIRNHYDAAEPEQRAALEAAARAVFEPLGVRPWGEVGASAASGADSYYLPQEDEALMELIALRTFYYNLGQSGYTDPSILPFMSLGIGRGSSKLGFVGPSRRAGWMPPFGKKVQCLPSTTLTGSRWKVSGHTPP
jgi:hypothetical protein